MGRFFLLSFILFISISCLEDFLQSFSKLYIRFLKRLYNCILRWVITFKLWSFSWRPVIGLIAFSTPNSSGRESMKLKQRIETMEWLTSKTYMLVYKHKTTFYYVFSSKSLCSSQLLSISIHNLKICHAMVTITMNSINILL
jgi:hypothetical protein